MSSDRELHQRALAAEQELETAIARINELERWDTTGREWTAAIRAQIENGEGDLDAQVNAAMGQVYAKLLDRIVVVEAAKRIAPIFGQQGELEPVAMAEDYGNIPPLLGRFFLAQTGLLSEAPARDHSNGLQKWRIEQQLKDEGELPFGFVGTKRVIVTLGSPGSFDDTRYRRFSKTPKIGDEQSRFYRTLTMKFESPHDGLAVLEDDSWHESSDQRQRERALAEDRLMLVGTPLGIDDAGNSILQPAFIPRRNFAFVNDAGAHTSGDGWELLSVVRDDKELLKHVDGRG